MGDDYAWYLALLIAFGMGFGYLILLNILFGALTGG